MLSGNSHQLTHAVRFVFNPDSLMLNYDRWNIPADNFVQYDSSGILVRNLKLEHNAESLSINSATERRRSRLWIWIFPTFISSTITQFAEQDSLLVRWSGKWQGRSERSFYKTLIYLRSENPGSVLQGDTVGNLVLKVNNEEKNAFAAHIAA